LLDNPIAEIALLRETVTAARDNIRALWSALGMIRDCVEELGPVGVLPEAEQMMPEPHDEAAAIIAAFQVIAESSKK